MPTKAARCKEGEEEGRTTTEGVGRERVVCSGGRRREMVTCERQARWKKGGARHDGGGGGGWGWKKEGRKGR